MAAPEAELVNVICMKWGERYDAAYVNILQAMVNRNLSVDHRFVCFTDDPKGISPKVETFPLPEIDLPADIPERCWRKLGVFRERLEDLSGPTLFLDLDVVIVDRLEPFFEMDGDFFISHDWRWYGKLPITGNSSCFRFEAGQLSDVYDYFCENSQRMREKFRNDQVYLSDYLHRQNRLNYWPDPWCKSFKSHCVPRVPFRYFVSPSIPNGTRVVLFHGKPDPPEAASQGNIGLRKFWKASPWILQHWNDAA